RDTRHLSRQIGFLKVSLNMETLRDLLTPPKDLEEISYHIIGADGKTMLSTSPDILETLPTGQELYGFAAQSLGGCRQEDSVFFSAYPIEKTDWILLSVSTDKGTKHFVTTMGISLTFSTLICIIVCLLIAIFFGNIVTKPLKQVGDLMSSVSGGDFSGTLDLGSCSELSLLANQFNDMNQKLQFLYNEVFQNEIRIKEAEFSALVSQMNPHFLYNTLDTIYWMAKSGNGEAVSDMVTSLSRLMRLSLSGNHGNFVALSTELEQINCYLAIQKIRFQDQITFDLRVEADCMDCRVLKLILQPLVENAIIHGINPVGNGSITIRIYAQGDELIYQVSNTGKLLNVEELKQLLASNTTETRGFALKNISERLRLAVGAKYPLTFGYEDGQTTFWVHQPILPFLAEEDD
ncbi:MAG: sensor histidine kinase, partial [Angelakisella sp.]